MCQPDQGRAELTYLIIWSQVDYCPLLMMKMEYHWW